MTLVRPLLKLAIVLLGTILVLELSFHLILAPQLRLAKVVFQGDAPQFDGPWQAAVGLRQHEYYFSVDDQVIQKRLERLPWVEHATVVKRFPGTLTITLADRKPLAISLVGGAVLAIDQNGLVFSVRTDAKGLDLPIISGVTFEALRAGSQFPKAVLPLFERLAQVRQSSPGVFRMISEVQLQRNAQGGFDAVIYPEQVPVRILLGDRWDLSTLQQMFVLLDVVKSQGWAKKTKEIDFRTTPVVLRARES